MSSSYDNQVKWRHDNMFAKLNCLGYESTAEVLVSHLLHFTDLAESEYVQYYSCIICEDGRELGLGCYSYDFVGNSSEITVADLLDEGAQSYAISYDDLREYLFDIVGFDVKTYIDKILCMDAICRNEDRHFRNIAFLYENGRYRPAPIFDNGAACMSDVVSYPLNVDFDRNYRSLLAKPFYTEFTRNLVNNRLLQIRYDDFVNSLDMQTDKSIRARDTIIRGLSETEGIAWRKC